MKIRIFLILVILAFFSNEDFSQVTLTSSNLPIIVINTHGVTIPDEPKITADMGVIDNGLSVRNNITDPFNAYNGKIGIEIRGHSSQSFPKKQYGVELRDDAGNDLKVGLLGFPEESDWVLNASYTDKSLLRNIIAYKLSNDLGHYASRTRYCEVVINGEYVGIYILQEKIKRDKNRVNIKKMSTADVTGNSVTGGYIVKIDRVDPGDVYWTSVYPAVFGSQKAPITYIDEYPKGSDIVPAQQNYIKEYINKFETIMYSGSYRDPFSGYYNLIDIDSFVDYYLVNEFSKNTDAYRLSTYLFKDRDSEGGKLSMGPIWDYDISFGLADYGEDYLPSGWQAYKHYDGIWSCPFWTTNLMIDPVFKNKLAKRWNKVKYTLFSQNTINSLIDENALLTGEARVRNFSKWKDLFNPAIYTWPNKNNFSNYNDEINYLKNWISQRTAWLNANISSNYSDVEWLTPDLSKISFGIGKEVKIPLSSFIQSKMNITTINFLTLDTNCITAVKGDTLSITILRGGTYLLKGVGLKDYDIVSISPDYQIIVPLVDGVYSDIPLSFKLFQNYPNPFNPTTSIRYHLPWSGHVSLKVIDLLGREVAILVDEFQYSGEHIATLNATSLPSGTYFCILRSGNYVETRKMLLIK